MVFPPFVGALLLEVALLETRLRVCVNQRDNHTGDTKELYRNGGAQRKITRAKGQRDAGAASLSPCILRRRGEFTRVRTTYSFLWFPHDVQRCSFEKLEPRMDRRKRGAEEFPMENIDAFFQQQRKPNPQRALVSHRTDIDNKNEGEDGLPSDTKKNTSSAQGGVRL